MTGAFWIFLACLYGVQVFGLFIYFTTPPSAWNDPRLFLPPRPRCPRCGCEVGR